MNPRIRQASLPAAGRKGDLSGCCVQSSGGDTKSKRCGIPAFEEIRDTSGSVVLSVFLAGPWGVMHVYVFFSSGHQQQYIYGGMGLAHNGVFSLRHLAPAYPEPEQVPAAARWVIVKDTGICIIPKEYPSIYFSGDPEKSGIISGRFQYLGHRGKVPYYASEAGEVIPEGLVFSGLRDLFGRVPDQELAIASYAVRIIGFDRTTRFCGRCGKETRQKRDERSKICDSCGLVTWPRLSPAIVVLVQRDDRLLLARSPQFPPGMFSLIAGFVEPGENLEQAVEREVLEETGIRVRNIRYFGSEPWPFPDSLMVGFSADFAGGELVFDKNEIESAFWFDREHLPRIPEKLSISRALIDRWVEERHRTDSIPRADTVPVRKK